MIAACHPKKDATVLEPYGGGAFLHEVDGNLTIKNNNGHVTMHWTGKYRGPDFAPVHFKLETVKCDAVRDSLGRQIPCVVVEPLTSMAVAEVQTGERRDEDRVLVYLANNPRATVRAVAEGLGWLYSSGKPATSRVNRAIEKLKAHGLIKKDGRNWVLTDAGEKEVEGMGD